MSGLPRRRANAGFVHVERVLPAHAGRTVLEHHVLRWSHSDERAWRDRIEAGLVLVAGEPAACDRILRQGEELRVIRPPWIEPDAPAGFTVLLEDEDVLVVDKPAGLQVLPAGSFLENTLLAQVRGSDPRRSEASPIHRLGRGTSGAIVFGKTARARSRLSRELREGRLGKLYLARVHGAPPDSFVVTVPIGPVETARGLVHAASPSGKASRSRFRVLRRDGARSLVAAWPITGRPDQLRIHLAAAGHPIVGDPLFAAAGLLLDARPGDGGYMLHSASLRLRHPATGRTVEVRAPAPDWADVRTDAILRRQVRVTSTGRLRAVC